MIRTLASFCLVLVTATFSFAQGANARTSSSPSRPEGGAVEKQITQLEREIADSIIKRDVETLNSALADDFALVSPDGQYQSRATVIAAVTSAEYVLKSIDFTDMKVRVYGDTAIATYISTDTSTYKGKDVSGKARTTDIFVRRAGKWQQVGAHSTSIPESTK